MTPRRRTLDRIDYRDLLESRGEVSIGAYARRQRRRRIAIGATGLLLITVALVLYWHLRPGPAAGADQLRTAVQCAACGHTQAAPLENADTSYPLPCGACGQRSVWPLWQCGDCSHEFRAEPTSRPACPKCGSARVGSPGPR